MRIIFRFFSIFLFAARRLWHNLPLMIGTAFGLIAAVALVISVPLYADGVNYRLMQRALAEQEQGSKRPPYAFMFRYVGSWHGPVDWPAFRNADTFMTDEAPAILGLPLDVAVRYVKTDNLRLFPAGTTMYSDPRQLLDRVALGFVSNFTAHVKILEGRPPAPQAADAQEPLDVIVSEDKAVELGLQVGEEFVLIGESTEQGIAIKQIQARVVGVWRARNPDDPYWFYRPSSFDGVFITDEQSFVNRVVPLAKNPVYLALWYLVFDGRGIHTEDVPGFMSRVTVAATMADKALPSTSLDISPMSALESYVGATRLLTVLMFVFSIPIIGLVLYFIILTTNLVVQRQRNEIAVLRSRGMSALQVVALYLLEGLILGGLAMVVGPLLGQGVAHLMGMARSFLAFGPAQQLLISLSQQSLRLALAAVVIALLSSIVPALGAARHTIVTYKQDLARSLEKPWWQRLYLDFMLLVVPLYGYYLLRDRGTISFLGRSVTASEGDPFRNPLLFLVPTLFVFSLALLFVRIFPLLMAILARVFEYLPMSAPLLALRQLSRAWGHYTGPLLLIILTMGLACFTASMARTLDVALHDQTYYDVGADLRLAELGEASEESADVTGNGSQAAPSSPTGAMQQKETYWTFLPVSEHLKARGVRAAARLATFGASVRLGQSQVQGKIIGIDRLDFLRTGYFRRDFAPESLGALINDLARYDNAVLVTPSFLGTFGLVVGDTFTLQLNRYLTTYDLPLTIAGVINLFPTTYPDEGPVFVANLDFIFEQMGGEYPYDVLIRTDPGVDTTRLVGDLGDLGLRIMGVTDSRQIIQEERERPERQGILGLLSVGAMAASFLTVLGLLFYAFVSFRRRFIELGILRAIGLSVPQMLLALGFEQFTLIVAGVAAGTGFGVLASKMFIPFLQVRGGPRALIPPFVVQIAWGDMLKVYVIFGTMLLVTVIGLVWLLARMRIAEAVKLGEAV